MVEEKSDIVTLMNVLTVSHGKSLLCFTRSIALEERGIYPTE